MVDRDARVPATADRPEVAHRCVEEMGVHSTGLELLHCGENRSALPVLVRPNGQEKRDGFLFPRLGVHLRVRVNIIGHARINM